MGTVHCQGQPAMGSPAGNSNSSLRLNLLNKGSTHSGSCDAHASFPKRPLVANFFACGGLVLSPSSSVRQFVQALVGGGKNAAVSDTD